VKAAAFSLCGKCVIEGRGIHVEELTARLRPIGKALAYCIQATERYSCPVCDLLLAFRQMLLSLLHFALCISIRNPQPNPC